MSDEFAAAEAAWKAELSQPDDELEGEAEQTDSTAEAPGQDADPAGEPEKAAPPEEADEAPAEATVEGEQSGEAAEAPQADQSTPAEPAPIEPFRLRADGVDIDLPGAFTQGGYVAMPLDAFYRVIQPRLVGDRRALLDKGIEQGRQKALADIENHPRIARAKVYEEEFTKLASMTPEDAISWAVRFVENKEVLQARAEATYWKQHAETHTTREKQAGEQQTAEQAEREKDEVLRGHIRQLLKEPEARGLDENRIFDLTRYDRRTYEKADRDYPERGIREGDEVIGLRFWQVVDAELKAMQAKAQSTTVASQKAKQNQAAVGQGPAKKPAPSVSTKGAHAAEVTKIKKEPTSLDEWREMVMADD